MITKPSPSKSPSPRQKSSSTKNNTRKTGVKTQSNKLLENLKTAKALQRDEAKKNRLEHVVNLINDTLWLPGLVVTTYIGISPASFDITDPAWSHSVMLVEGACNFDGLFGAYPSDVGYHLFGLSLRWWIVASCVFSYKDLHPLQKQENHKPCNHRTAGMALLLLLFCSPILEFFLSNNILSDRLPVDAGGLVSAVADIGLSWLLGKSGSLLVIVVILLLAVLLLMQVS